MLNSSYVQKAKRPKTWTCEAYVKRENLVCAQSEYKYCRLDRTDYHQSTMQGPGTLGPTKFKHAIRQLRGTNHPQLNTFDYSSILTFFDDIQKQLPFKTTKLNIFHHSAFCRNGKFSICFKLNRKKDVCLDR